MKHPILTCATLALCFNVVLSILLSGQTQERV
jgi:hypothetical protein